MTDRSDYRVSTLISNITEDADKGNWAYQMLPEFPTLEDVRYVFDRLGLRWNELAEHDAINALSGDWFDYFTDWNLFAADALIEMDIVQPPPRGEIIYGWQTVELWEKENALRQAELQQYGVPVTSFLGNGWACPREQERFYKTDAWRRCSAAQRYIWNYKCTRCGLRGVGLHVHHLMPIQTGYTHNFSLNFSPWKLTLLCENCHRDYHRRAVRGHGSSEYDIVGEADARKDKAFIRQAWKVVHELGRCEYCRCHQQVQP